LKEFGVVKNIFKQNMKIESKKLTQNLLMRYKRKTKQNKKVRGALSCRKEWDVHRKEKNTKK